MAKRFKVGFKTINAKLKVTKKHLERIRKHVTKREQKVIDAQVEAIDVILAACGKERMSATYTGNDD
jgi:hypothetical protein